jgi:hypothetical protein
MKILMLGIDPNWRDYIYDFLIHGFRAAGHTVTDCPKTSIVYKDTKNKYYTIAHKAIMMDDIYQHELTTDYDYCFLESAGILLDKYPFWHDKREFLHDVIKRGNFCTLLGNDPFTRQPLYNGIYPSLEGKIAIREQQSQNIITFNKPYFPLQFMVPEEYCQFSADNKRENKYFASFGYMNNIRRQLLPSFKNKRFFDPESYYAEIRNSKFGISIAGDGVLCQRDPEIMANSILCRYDHSGYKYEEDNCIYWKSIKDLEYQTEYLMQDEVTYKRMLEASYKEVLAKFTTKAQAQNLLSWCLKQ